MPLLIAHNGRAFDIPFLHLELQRNSLALPENTLFFDTYRYAKEVLPLMKQDLGSYSQVCTCIRTLIPSVDVTPELSSKGTKWQSFGQQTA